jgi:hypothetical protein
MERLFGEKQLEIFGNRYVDILTAELKSAGKVASGKLLQSLDYRIVREANIIQIIIQANDYLTYVDAGRKPGSFPPLKAIQSWTKLKGIPQSAAFPIARSIFKFGIKPTNVIEKTNRKIVSSNNLTTLQKIVANNIEKYVSQELFDPKKLDIKA